MAAFEEIILYQGQIQEFSIGVQTLFKKKSGGTWAPTHSQVPCLCKNKGLFTNTCKEGPDAKRGALKIFDPCKGGPEKKLPQIFH